MMNYRSKRRPPRSKPTRKRSVPMVLAVIGAILLLSGLGYRFWSEGQTGQSALAYDPEEVVYDRPFLAVHEMGDGPSIPFLPREQAQPRILLPREKHDFGSMGPTDVAERSFIIRNIGQAPLTISRAYTTCGCTTAEISARVIPPDKTAIVKIIFDAGFHDTTGQTVRRGLILENNDPRQPQAEIWIQATVRHS